MTEPKPKVMCVVGARPNFMKIAPILAAARRRGSIDTVLVHTGQHYDLAMNDSFFRQLRIPAPDISLDVGSASHAVQTAEIMTRFEPVLDAERPDCILVVGDVNSTIACALVAAKKGIRVVHVEAGLRSGDRSMPEEINRILTDALSDRLYITEADAAENLAREGVPPERVVFAGNVMIDSLEANRHLAVPAAATLGFTPESYAVCTLHRPSNVDDLETLASLVDTLIDIQARIPLIFVLHPRTRSRLDAGGFGARLESHGIRLLPPQGYLEMLGLLQEARMVLTDSGGLQEETTALGMPCLTLRQNTERPITITQGTNVLVGIRSEAIRQGVDAVLRDETRQARRPDRWDGRAAERIIDDLAAWLRPDTLPGPGPGRLPGHA